MPPRCLPAYSWAVLTLGLLTAVGVAVWRPVGEASAQQDNRYFSDTGFRIDDDQIWDYFVKRGRARTFGLPTSRTFTLLGAKTQFFQRQVVQAGRDGVRTLNLLDDGFLPYTTINGSTFPPADAAVTAGAPRAGTPNYGSAAVEFVKKQAPDAFDGQPTAFLETFSTTVTLADAFPDGGGDEGLLPLLDLEIWGLPTSKPMRDPHNNNFVYLRFQRGIMHYDGACRCTQGLLLADRLKTLITGQGLPDDLAAQAADSRFLGQYDLGLSNGPLRPDDLPGTDLANAFRPSLDRGTAGALPRAAPKPVAAKPAETSTQKPAEKPQASAPPSSGSGDVGNLADPRDYMIPDDAPGKDAVRKVSEDGTDSGARWSHIRWARDRETLDVRTGPIVVDNKVWVAKDVPTAQTIYKAEVAKQEKFPEVSPLDKLGGNFEFKIDKLGDEITALSACDDCNGRNINLHQRVVLRKGTVVAVIYLYGRESVTKQEIAVWFTGQVANRLP